MAKNKKTGSKPNKSKKSSSPKNSNANRSSGESLARAAAGSASAKRQGQGNQKQGKQRTGLFSYIRGVRQELSKVVWPTREELTTDTIVVIATVIFFAVAFWLIDTGFLAALKGLLGITLS